MPLLPQSMVFQSTLSVRRATDCRPGGRPTESISIHALREESDLAKSIMPLYPSIFQSTLSVRRATGTWDSRLHGLTISIHALREESDLWG